MKHRTRKAIAYAYPTSENAKKLGVYKTGGYYVERSILREDGSWSPGFIAPDGGQEAFAKKDDPDLLAIFREAEGEVSPYSMKNPRKSKRKSSTVWTPEKRRAFALKMKAARAARRGKSARVSIRRGNPRAGAVDRTAQHELVLYADNTSELYPQKLAIIKNIERRLAKGTYDPSKAVRLWLYWIDAAAKRYAREFGTPGAVIFTPATRRAAAHEMSEREYDMIKRGEYRNPRRRRSSVKRTRIHRPVRRNLRTAAKLKIEHHGHVIRVKHGHTLYYFSRDNVLSTSMNTARTFKHLRAAKHVAQKLANLVPRGMKVYIVGNPDLHASRRRRAA